MDIQPGLKLHTAEVRFDTHDERRYFGSYVMFSALEGIRWLAHTLHLPSYSDDPETYPQTVTVRLKTLGKVLVGFIQDRDAPNQKMAMLQIDMAHTINNHFKQRLKYPGPDN